MSRKDRARAAGRARSFSRGTTDVSTWRGDASVAPQQTVPSPPASIRKEGVAATVRMQSGRGQSRDGSVRYVDVPSRPLTPEDVELIEFARQIVEANSDGEYGIHTMGAAVRAVDGTVYGGINLYHFTGGPCAELVALGHARASGARGLSAIVAVGSSDRGPQAPCGRCRQVLSDYHPTIRVILPLPQGVRSVLIKDLLPLGYVWADDAEPR